MIMTRQSQPKQSKFWDKIAEKYARQPIADAAAYQKKLEITRGYFRPDWQVMEFGCGTGSTALAHARYVKHIDAVDFSAKMIEIARRKAAAQSITNVLFEQSTIEEFTAPENFYDAILGLSILHLLEDKEAAIAKVRHMLKPGGVFVTSTVCVGDKMKWFKYVGPIGRALGVMPLVKVFTREELVASILEAGFEIECNWRPDGAASVFIVARKPE